MIYISGTLYAIQKMKNIDFIAIVCTAITLLLGCGKSPVNLNNEFKNTESAKQKTSWFTIEDVKNILTYFNFTISIYRL